MRVVISGAAGQLGSYFAEYLKPFGFTLVGLHRGNHNLRDFSETYTVDYLRDSATDIIKQTRPDYFINCASLGDVGVSWEFPQLYKHVNTFAVEDLLTSIRAAAPHCRFLNFGTSEEFFGGEGLVKTEESELVGLNPYAKSKIGAREVVSSFRDYGVFAIQNWLTNTESPRRSSNFVFAKVCNYFKLLHHPYSPCYGLPGIPLEIRNSLVRRDRMHALDAVRGCWLSLTNEEPREYCFGSGEATSIQDIINECVSYLGVDKHFQVETDQADDTPFVVLDTTKAYQELGWEPRISFEKMVHEFVDNW